MDELYSNLGGEVCEYKTNPTCVVTHKLSNKVMISLLGASISCLHIPHVQSWSKVLLPLFCRFTKHVWWGLTGFTYSSKLTALKTPVVGMDLIPSPTLGCDGVCVDVFTSAGTLFFPPIVESVNYIYLFIPLHLKKRTSILTVYYG